MHNPLRHEAYTIAADFHILYNQLFAAVLYFGVTQCHIIHYNGYKAFKNGGINFGKS